MRGQQVGKSASGKLASGKSASWQVVVPRVLIGLALLAFVGYFIVYLIYAGHLFQFPFDYDQGEGFELMDTVLFSQGEWPYRDNNVYPFYSSNYPPLFHVFTVPLVWLFGPQYWTGRLVSFLGTLVTAVAITYAVGRENKKSSASLRFILGKRPWLSLIVGLGFLASNYVYHVGPLFRQHMFMVMFETLAVVWLARTIDREKATGRRNNKALLAVMILLLFAGYTKQLAYATVAAVFIFLFLRQPKRAVVWAVPFAAVTGLIFLWINAATDGFWFLNTVTANVNPFVPGQFEGLFRQWLRLHTLFIVVAAGFAAYQLYFERLSVYSIWFVVAALNSVTAGKWGAGESYFATAVAASLILTGLALNRLLDWSENRRANWQFALQMLIPLLLLWQAGKLFHMPTHTPTLAAIANALGQPTEVMIAPQTSCSAPREPELIPYVDSAGVSLLGRPPNKADTAAGIAITELIARGETAAFAEDAGFNFYLGRDVVTNPTQLLNLYNNNAVDLTEMLAMLDEQAFDTVVLRAQFYPPEVLNAIGQRYETTDLVQMNGFVYCVMTPRPVE
jgi:4-amino-4-deoxy-L-arabinose transferase-like glycosyltransferase